MFPVIVVPYDPAWPGMFEAERTAILSALADLDPEIEHIGSTSVPGLAAKPKIDILVGLRGWGDLEAAVDLLSRIGYEHEPQLAVPRHLSMKRGRPTTHRVHLVERRGGLWDDYLSFRDALRTDRRLRVRYGQLKQALALHHRDDHHAYMTGKASFIEGVIERERAARGHGAPRLSARTSHRGPASLDKAESIGPGDARSLQLDQFGEGSSPAIFVHGSGRAGAAAWPEQVRLSGRRLLFVHLRGFGGVEEATGFDYETDTHDLVGLLWEAEPSHLVGASYGGISALMATMRSEGRVASLTLIEPILLSIARGDEAVEELVAKTQHALEAQSLEEFEGRLEQAIGLKIKRPWTEEDRRWLERFKAQRPPWDAPIPPAPLPDMGIPLLVVTGGWSEANEAIAQRLVEDFGAHHEVIEGAGHRPQDHPVFNPLLEGWWSSAETRA